MGIENKTLKIGISAALSVLIFIVGFGVSVGRWQERVNNRLVALEDSVQEIEELEEKVLSQDVRYAEIKADLAWIKTALLRLEEGTK